jgi:hypothetical protein
MEGREGERLEEDEVLNNLPISLTPDGTLPRELQHLLHAIDRLNRRGVIILLSNGHGPRWAIAKPGTP